MGSEANHGAGDLVVTERAGTVLQIRMNSPKTRNALSMEMMHALEGAIASSRADETARVVVLTGTGPIFSAGHDLKELHAHKDEEFYARTFSTLTRVMLALTSLDKPVIAKVQGAAAAAGCQLVATCDLAVAARGVWFATPGIDVGLFCTTPGVALTRNLQFKHAMEMLLTGSRIDAERAYEIGLVNRVVAPDELDDAVAELAGVIAEKPAAVVAMGKRAVYEQLNLGLADAYRHAESVMTKNALGPDGQEGLAAFAQKRKPAWREPADG